MRARLVLTLALLVPLLGCDDSNDTASAAGPDVGVVVDAPTPPALDDELNRLRAVVDEAAALDADALLARHAVPFAESLGYDPLDAQNLEVVQASPFALDDDELATLAHNGFVISARQPLGHFVAGYERIYNADLPVYFSADSMLHVLHRSFSTLLQNTERRALMPALDAWLEGLRARLADGAAAPWGDQAERDIDLYLTTALSLLRGAAVAPVTDLDPALLTPLLTGALAAEGLGGATLFGQRRQVDFSQFRPRSHYADDEQLSRYFRASIWLGRIDVRMVETDEGGAQRLNRDAVAATLAFADLIDDDLRAQWARIDAVLTSLVGPQDFMTVDRLGDLVDALALPRRDAAGLAAVDDVTLTTRVLAGGFGVQRIASHVIAFYIPGRPVPLALSFTLLGQRYVVDSHVLANVVHDRVQVPGKPMRMLPDPLDAAFAAFGNDQAAALLEPELRAYGYAGHLAAMRDLTDALGPEAWSDSLYGGWLGAVRALSPDTEVVADPAAAGRPAVVGTDAWGRRLLNTQIASWAELRHDTVLYAKQSYTGGAGCDYPDGYVEPVPAFWDALVALAERGRAVAEGPLAELDPAYAEQVAGWWGRLHAASSRLGDLARQQITGVPFDAEQVMWLEQAVDVAPDDYIGFVVGGWYPELILDPEQRYEADELVVDVHTQPFDAQGNAVGRVLHLGTSAVRLMVVTVESCTGPRAYVGPVATAHALVTEQFERLTDEEWRQRLRTEGVDDLPWMQDLIVR